MLDNRHISSSEPHVTILINFRGQEAVTGLTEGKRSLLKVARSRDPGAPPSLPTLTLSNSKLQHSCKFRTCKFPRTAGSLSMQIPSQGYTVLVSASSLPSPGQTWTRSDRLVSDKTRRQTYFETEMEMGAQPLTCSS